MTNLNLNVDEVAWNFALAKDNSEGQQKSDTDNAKKAESDRVAFVPQTLASYVQMQLDQIGASFSKLQTRDHIAIISAQPALDIARLAKAAALPDGPERTQLAATVDALA